MNERGFTLIELLLSVAILTLLIGLSLPVYETFVRRNDLDVTTQAVASAIRRAETYARGVNQDSTWGVEFVAPNVTLFKGATYASRDVAYDETIPLPGSVTSSGISEVVFTKLAAVPSISGGVTLGAT